ncbi:thiopeptide-type bacteriocin biosynthesis protein [Bacillus cereus group sp. BfR-BA-01430]|uniref:thiopeptide-type bacteriocin biosynthesis protein n=1 Tax=Bacillus cereus group sp. BfR-BA-01430 TaxID=2920346 RepID=UPI001F5A68FA|nr:thiopeptide-type bacteriocin biosynthesis protein [Bacillus cereus group sp. BfR-BA-01430]
MDMWFSYHAYIHDYNALDKYMSEKFPKFIEENIPDKNNWFFIRYWLGGPHIRLRVNNKQSFNHEFFREKFQKSIEDFISKESIKLIDYDNFYNETMLKGENISSVFWKQHGIVEKDNYEPEYDRYGGREGMEISENIFSQSSNLVLKLNTLSFGYRLIVATDLLFWTIKELDLPNSIYSTYKEMWKMYKQPNYSDDSEKKDYLIKKRVDHLKKLNVPQKAYSEYLEALKKLKGFPLHVILSHIHMSNNRLGVHPELEYEIAKSLSEMRELTYEIK